MQTDLPLFQRQQLAVIVGVTPHAMAGHILNTTVLALVLAGSIPTFELIIWCVYSYAIAAALIWRHVRSRGRVPRSFRHAANRAAVYAFLLALPWGTMGVMHLGALAHGQELILIALAVGMAASGTILLSAVPSAAFSYMSGILIPGAVKCFILLDQKVYLLLGVLALSYWWFLAALIAKIAREINEREQADVALREGETRLQEALTAGQVVAFTWDPGTGQSHRSENALQLLGLAATGRPGKDFLPRVHPDDRQCFAAHFKELRPDSPSYSTSFRFARLDGQQAWLEEVGKAEFDADGRYLRLKGLTRDITERKEAEEKLHNSEHELRRSLEALAERTTQLALAEKSALVGSFAYDVGTDTLRISDGYAAIHGFPSEAREIARSKWQAGVHPEDRVRLDEIRSRTFCTRSPEYTVDFRIIRPSGDVRWIEGRAFVAYRSDGSPQRVVGVNIDVTDRKRAEEQLRTLNAELDHRVKNVLATVSSVASQTLDPSSSVNDYVDALHGRLRSMASTHELLSSTSWRGIPLAELLQRELAPYATGSNTETSGPEVTLSAEAGQAIAMVLHELTTNAAKYGALCTRGGRVSVRWYWPANRNAPDRLVIEWQEIGGPSTAFPSRSGYGTSVIRELILYELGGKTDLTFTPDGVRCRLEIPAKWVGPAAGQAPVPGGYPAA